MAQRMSGGRSDTGMGEMERYACLGGGGLLLLLGVRRGGWLGAALAVAGGSLLYSVVTGQSVLGRVTGGRMTDARGVGEAVGSAARRLIPAVTGGAQPTTTRHSVTIDRPREELYSFWRDFSNLPRVMDHLERVEVIDDRRSHWVAKAPGGGTVEWDAEVTEERPNDYIGWRSVEGSEIPNEGVVRFRDAPGGRGTEVEAELTYTPPAGQLGRTVAKILGEEPDRQVPDALRRFKQIMETGEVPTTEGQPSGRGR